MPRIGCRAAIAFLLILLQLNILSIAGAEEPAVVANLPAPQEDVVADDDTSPLTSVSSSISSSFSSPNIVQPGVAGGAKGNGEIDNQNKDHNIIEDLNFQKAKTFAGGMFSSLTFVIVSELGDKTFFIAAIMAMRYSRRMVFLGAIAALWLMTILSILIGVALPTLFVPEYYTHYAAIALFFIFGARLLREAFSMSDEGKGEYEEAEAEIDKKDEDSALNDLEAGIERKMEPYVIWGYDVHPIFIQVFTMTFLAEWGDRSQIATIALAARGNAYGVTTGGVLGHAFCTMLAVLGGRIAKEQISERTVSFLGGALFILFGIHEIIFGV